jgi:predicted TIM-barrel fold metal-dependent hydrolase
MFVDVHTHVFHPRIAEKAKMRLHEHYKLPCRCKGTPEDLLMRAQRCGIDHCVALCAATSAAQVQPCNAYAGHLQNSYPEITAFGSIHPDCEDWKEQLDKLRTYGVRGIKLHPDFQGFRLDDPRLLPIFEEAQDDFVFLIHIGDTLPPEQNPSCPYKMAKILDNFPDMRVIAAHFGGYRHWDHSLAALVGRNVWMDTSSCMDEMTDAQLTEVLRRHPRDYILFGTDYPIRDPWQEMHALQRRTRFSSAEMDEVLSNGAHILFS